MTAACYWAIVCFSSVDNWVQEGEKTQISTDTQLRIISNQWLGLCTDGAIRSFRNYSLQITTEANIKILQGISASPRINYLTREFQFPQKNVWANEEDHCCNGFVYFVKTNKKKNYFMLVHRWKLYKVLFVLWVGDIFKAKEKHKAILNHFGESCGINLWLTGHCSTATNSVVQHSIVVHIQCVQKVWTYEQGCANNGTKEMSTMGIGSIVSISFVLLFSSNINVQTFEQTAFIIISRSTDLCRVDYGSTIDIRSAVALVKCRETW